MMLDKRKTTESVHCAITGPCLHMSQAFSTSSVPMVKSCLDEPRWRKH